MLVQIQGYPSILELFPWHDGQFFTSDLGKLFLWGAAEGTVVGLYRSMDTGRSWQAVSSTPAPTYDGRKFFTDSFGNVFSFVIYFGGDSINLFRSDSSGENPVFVGHIDDWWSKAPNFMPLAIAPNGELMVQLDKGLWLSRDKGTTWQFLGVPNTDTTMAYRGWGILCDSLNNFFVSIGSGLYRYDQPDSRWIHIQVPDATVQSLATGKNGELLAGCAVWVSASLTYRSQDEGRSWSLGAPSQTFNNPNPYILDSQYDAATAEDGSGNLLILRANYFDGTLGSILRSTDEGLSWVSTSSFAGQCLCVAGDRAGILYAGTLDNRLFISTDAGVTWDQQVDGITNPSIYSIAVATTGNVFAGSQNTIFRNEQGSYWDKLKVGLTKSNVTNIAIDSQNVIYAGTDHEGVIRSMDNGDSWQPFSSGLPKDSAINALIVLKNGSILAATNIGIYILGHGDYWWDNASAGLLEQQVLSLASSDTVCYAGTGHDGVFRASLKSLEAVAGVSKTVQADALELSPNYPNPLSSSTQISYTLPQNEFVTVTVSDVLGNVRMTLRNGRETAGQHSVMLDGHRLPSGVYYYTLETTSNRITRTMMVVK
jgi:hypothetical protein